MLCDRCHQRPVTKIVTRMVNGERVASYLCEECSTILDRPALDRPCAACRQREGTVPVTRLGEGYRRVRYLCEECAKKL
jgi:protein-arginine kinase activator protein McsA